MEEPSTTGSNDSGVMNGTGKARGGGEREEGVVGRGSRGGGIENMLYQSIQSAGRHCHGDSTYVHASISMFDSDASVKVLFTEQV